MFRRAAAFLLFASRLAGRKEKKILKNADLVMTENHFEGETLVKVNRNGLRAYTGAEKEVAADQKGKHRDAKGHSSAPHEHGHGL